jgi:hypothetical protein
MVEVSKKIRILLDRNEKLNEVKQEFELRYLLVSDSDHVNILIYNYISEL